jgi:hypothetical protein
LNPVIKRIFEKNKFVYSAVGVNEAMWNERACVRQVSHGLQLAIVPISLQFL